MVLSHQGSLSLSASISLLLALATFPLRLPRFPDQGPRGTPIMPTLSISTPPSETNRQIMAREMMMDDCNRLYKCPHHSVFACSAAPPTHYILLPPITHKHTHAHSVHPQLSIPQIHPPLAKDTHYQAFNQASAVTPMCILSSLIWFFPSLLFNIELRTFHLQKPLQPC